MKTLNTNKKYLLTVTHVSHTKNNSEYIIINNK